MLLNTNAPITRQQPTYPIVKHEVSSVSHQSTKDIRIHQVKGSTIQQGQRTNPGGWLLFLLFVFVVGGWLWMDAKKNNRHQK